MGLEGTCTGMKRPMTRVSNSERRGRVPPTPCPQDLPLKIFIYRSKKQRTSAAMATLVARYCQKTTEPQSMQGIGMHRTPKRFLSPRNTRKCCQEDTKTQVQKNTEKNVAVATVVTFAKKRHHYSSSPP